jgi:hypothetical protein
MARKTVGLNVSTVLCDGWWTIVHGVAVQLAAPSSHAIIFDLAMATGTPSKDRNLLAVIGDEVCHHFDILLFPRGHPCITGHYYGSSISWYWPNYTGSTKEFFYRRNEYAISLARTYSYRVQVYFSETEVHNIENAFSEYTQRDDIAILLINQHVRPST